MAQLIKQGNIFGRIGTGIGKGLAEQAPKEIERSRLASGLKELGGKKELSPFEQFAELSSIPGVTPQMIESGSKLLREQGTRNAYNRKSGGERNKEPQGNSNVKQALQDMQFANIPQNEKGLDQQKSSNVAPEEFGQPQVNPNNPLREEAQTRLPWDSARRDKEISNIFEDFPNITLPEAVAMAADNEKRELARPEAERAIDENLEKIKERLENKFKKKLELKLQKTGEGVFKDVTGENINNAQRGIERDLRLNPKASEDDVINDWTNRVLQQSKNKSEVDKLAARDIGDQITKQDQTLQKLKTFGKSYAEAGNSEEYFNILRSDFNMSDQGAAYIAYPLSKSINGYMSKIKSSNPTNFRENSKSYAANIENLITSKDSILAISRELREIDPYFDQKSFFNQLREDMDDLGLNPRQKREIGIGESSVFPNWGDLSILPTFRGIK
jgi:hypothetical protein